MQLPSTSPITLPFGSIDSPYSQDSPHMGTDFAYIPDNKIYAPFTGRVILVPNNGRDGNGIYMYNGDQFHGMLHSSQYLVPNGTMVQEGQPIAIMGDTGFAQGIHLHWCVKVNGTFINPMSLIDNMKEEEMKPTYQEVLDAFRTYIKTDCTEVQQNYYVAHDKSVLFEDLLKFNTDRLREVQNSPDAIDAETYRKLVADLGKAIK